MSSASSSLFRPRLLLLPLLLPLPLPAPQPRANKGFRRSGQVGARTAHDDGSGEEGEEEEKEEEEEEMEEGVEGAAWRKPPAAAGEAPVRFLLP